MGDHPNAAIVRAAMESMSEGDMSSWDTLVDDDIVWHQIGADEPIRGKEALGESMKIVDGVDFKIETHDVLANDDHTVALVTATITAGGESLTYRTAEIMHISDGKVTERWAFSDDTAAITEFFASLMAG
jgi:ketosteroid isomerase-like protein